MNTVGTVEEEQNPSFWYDKGGVFGRCYLLVDVLFVHVVCVCVCVCVSEYECACVCETDRQTDRQTEAG